MKLTVVIPALNEQQDLPRTLDSLKFADEILVIDSGSTDQTVSLAKKAGAKVIHHAFENFADTRNFADSQAKNDFILSIEADVVVPKQLAQEIASLPDTPAVYRIGRINIIFNKPILHTDWGPKDDNHIRLYHRSLGSWGGQVHELFVTNSRPHKLRHYLLHYNYNHVSEFIDKINTYSDLEVKKRLARHQSFSYLNLFLEPTKDFIKRYFYKLGFLDGLHGFFLSLLQAIYYLTVNIKLKSAST